MDSKCDYPAACNAMETLLVHKDQVRSGLAARVCEELIANGVSSFTCFRSNCANDHFVFKILAMWFMMNLFI